MKIYVEQWKIKDECDNSRNTYHSPRYEPCCEEIVNHTDVIDFITAHDSETGDNGLHFLWQTTHHDNWDDYEWETHNNICLKYCPFCGSKIEVIVEKKIDKQKECEEIISMCHKENEIFRKTDSMKRQTQAYENMNKLEKQLKKMITSFSLTDGKEEE